MDILVCKTCGRLEIEAMVGFLKPANPMSRHCKFKHDASLNGWTMIFTDRTNYEDRLNSSGVTHREGI